MMALRTTTMRRDGRRCFVCIAAALAVCLLPAGSRVHSFSVGGLRTGAHRLAGAALTGEAAQAALPSAWGGTAAPAGLSACGLCAVLAVAGCAVRGLAVIVRRARKEGADGDLAMSRRVAVLPAALLTGGAACLAPEATFAEAVELPDRINADPYDLIGMTNPEDSKVDKKEFYMKKDYKQDTYQVLKHMKISASLDKGTPNMEKWNRRIKEEMDDWVALYRRQDAVVGRQSYYSLYSAVNTLASHFTSYGPKFPFPNKRRPRFFELVNTTEKYLEKNK
uniref:Uncharacterized protein n=1 Tax=Alexandrium monilatum TaxID=311494 RepID=A0A7S4VDU9_9DINO